MPERIDPGYLRMCDSCCDYSGTAKEMVKTGGCTCDICGWACKCCGDDGKQFVNRIPVRVIPDDGWDYLQWKNLPLPYAHPMGNALCHRPEQRFRPGIGPKTPPELMLC